jgi:hypothetical protein
MVGLLFTLLMTLIKYHQVFDINFLILSNIIGVVMVTDGNIAIS